jgi:integrase
MATRKLTKTAVEAIEAGDADKYAWDTELPRFGVRVTPAAARIYLIQYRAKPAPGGKAKTRRITIGQHGPWTVEHARSAAKELLANVDLGRDPFADREAEREARQQAADAAAAAQQAAELRMRDTFEAVAERYIDLCLTKKSGAETARLIRYDAVPVWRGRHIAEVRRADVADLTDTIKKRSPAVARSTYAALRGLFSWCVERDLIAASPCDAVTAPPRPEARDRVLADDELRLIWKASDGLGPVFSAVVKLLALTGQRRAEVAGMAWTELDIEAATWRIPRERAKNGRAHEIDLCAEAVAILRKVEQDGELVFPVRRSGAAAGPVRGFSAVKRHLDRLIEALRAAEAVEAEVEPPKSPLPTWRLHDLRRTAATGMAGMNFAPHVVERVLNHVSGVQSGLVGVYQRHEYRAEREAASLGWGARVAEITSGRPAPSNVRRLRA